MYHRWLGHLIFGIEIEIAIGIDCNQFCSVGCKTLRHAVAHSAKHVQVFWYSIPIAIAISYSDSEISDISNGYVIDDNIMVKQL